MVSLREAVTLRWEGGGREGMYMNEGGLLSRDMLSIFSFGGVMEVITFGGRVVVRVGPGGAGGG